MANKSGDDMINDFYQRGRGELAVARRKADPANPAPSSGPRADGPSRPAPRVPANPGGAPNKQRKRTREQLLVLAFARLLAARMR